MPEFPEPNPDLTREQTMNMILTSIAMEELALSHILNAEGEKIQYILGKSQCGKQTSEIEDVLAVNKSVTVLLEMVMQNQLILKNKMEKVLEYFPKPVPPKPPCPPIPLPPPCRPCQPDPPCPPPDPCIPQFQTSGSCQYKPYARFSVIPGMYDCGSVLQWRPEEIEPFGRDDNISTDCSKIQLPRSGWLKVSLSLDFYSVYTSKGTEIAELLITCSEKRPILKLFRSKAGQYQTTLSGDAVIQLPCSCSPCNATLTSRLPSGLQIKSGKLSFDRIV